MQKYPNAPSQAENTPTPNTGVAVIAPIQADTFGGAILPNNFNEFFAAATTAKSTTSLQTQQNSLLSYIAAQQQPSIEFQSNTNVLFPNYNLPTNVQNSSVQQTAYWPYLVNLAALNLAVTNGIISGTNNNNLPLSSIFNNYNSQPLLGTTASSSNMPLTASSGGTCDTIDSTSSATALFNNILANLNENTKMFTQNSKLSNENNQNVFNNSRYLLKTDGTSDGESSPRSWYIYFF